MQANATGSLTGIRRDEASALTRDELDMVVLGQIMACMSVSNVVGPSHKHTPHRRVQVKTSFFTRERRSAAIHSSLCMG